MNDDEDNTTRRTSARYRVPPAEHRFRKGVSGNPAGRPRLKRFNGRRLEQPIILRVLEEPVPVVERGKKRHMSAQEVVIRRTLVSAMNGDLKAVKYLLDWGQACRKAREGPAPTLEDLERLSIEELQVLEHLTAKLSLPSG